MGAWEAPTLVGVEAALEYHPVHDDVLTVPVIRESDRIRWGV